MKLVLATLMSTVLVVSACSSDEDSTVDTGTDGTESVESETEEAESEDTDAEESETGEDSEASGSTESRVEVNLIDELDGVTNGFCLDIAGGNENVETSNGLQTHTCYSYQGDLGTDQVFDGSQFADNVFYMPDFDVCIELSEIAVGATVSLNTCDGSDAQSLAFSGSGPISPVSDDSLCLTAGDESSFGRSEVHQIRDLTVQTCSDDLAATQTWSSRTSL